MNAITAAKISSAAYYPKAVLAKKLTEREGAFADKLSAKADNKPQTESFEDMYCRTDYDPLDSTGRIERDTHFVMTLTENELPEFMEMAREEFKKGKSLEEVVMMQNQKDLKNSDYFGTQYKAVDCRGADQFYIDKRTGEVTFSHTKVRGMGGSDNGEHDIDVETVHNIADDLNTFLRYAAFPDEEDDHERVERLFEYIKEKQNDYSVTRFDSAFDPGKYVDEFFTIPEITAGEKQTLKEKEKEGEPIDDLIETLRVHQEQLNAKKENRPVTGKQTELEHAIQSAFADDKT